MPTAVIRECASVQADEHGNRKPGMRIADNKWMEAVRMNVQGMSRTPVPTRDRTSTGLCMPRRVAGTDGLGDGETAVKGERDENQSG